MERPVFHELTRHLQTRQLIAGDTLLLEEEQAFCLVVNGEVQVFAKYWNDDKVEEDAGDYDMQSYQLLTEAKNGVPLSSLFTILSLFTENIEVSDKDSVPDLSNFSVPLAGEETLLAPVPHLPQLSEHKNNKKSSMHPNIVARATQDSTIAVIPAEAFRRLVRMYPKSSAHIVQVILTRFQRVTLLTAHKYLGLTSEILKVEQALNDELSYDLPNYLQSETIARLKNKLKADYNSDIRALDSKHDVITPRSSRSKHPSMSKQSLPVIAAKRNATRVHGEINSEVLRHREASVHSGLSNHSAESPLIGATDEGDDSVHLSDSKESLSPPDDPLASHHEMTALRDAVLKCLFKATGITDKVSGALSPRSGAASVEASPRLVSYDAQKQKAVFSQSFGAFELPHLADSNSSAFEDETTSVFSAMSMHSAQTELENDVEILYFNKDDILVNQDEHAQGLYYVIDGFLEVCSQSVEESASTRRFDLYEVTNPASIVDDRTHRSENPAPKVKSHDVRRNSSARKLNSLFLVKPGGLAGYLGSISGFRSFVQVRAKTDVLVGFLPQSAIERITEIQPIVQLSMAKRLISLLNPLILHIDFALEWVQVNGGQLIYNEGDISDAIYLVLNGRLRLSSQTSKEGKVEITVEGEFGQGQSVGELDVLTESRRDASLRAIRDTELVRLPRTLFNTLSLEHPRVTLQISRMVAKRMSELLHNHTSPKGQPHLGFLTEEKTGAKRSTINMRNVAIMPSTSGFPAMQFAERLLTAFMRLNFSVFILHQSTVIEHLGRHAFSRIGKLKLLGYLADLEERYDMVLYVVDSAVNSAWTRTCISQVRKAYNVL